jgi:hypothetical protein
MLNIVEPVIKLCWVRYICYADTYFYDSNNHVYRNVNGYGYPLPWWVRDGAVVVTKSHRRLLGAHGPRGFLNTPGHSLHLRPPGLDDRTLGSP